MHEVIEWFLSNYIEVIGTIAGLVYLYFSINQKIWLWPLGILTSGFYVYIFFQNRLYADMSLNAYYIIISIYGWYVWLNGKDVNESKCKVQRLNIKNNLILTLYVLLLWIGIAYALYKLPPLLNIPKPDLLILDALTTSASIVATYMLGFIGLPLICYRPECIYTSSFTQRRFCL